MKTIILTLNFILCAVLLSSCEMRDELKGGSIVVLNKDEGLMSLDLLSNGTGTITRSNFNDEDVNPEKYTVKIIDATTEQIKKECTYNELKATGGQVKLTAGSYRVIAYNYDGSEVDASVRPFFQGQTEFQILAGKTTKVNTTCKLQSIEVVLGISDEFNKMFQDDYTIILTNGERGTFLVSKETANKIIYFKVPAQDKSTSIQMTVKATTTDNITIAQSYTITKPVDAENGSSLSGGDSFKIKIDPGDTPGITPVTKIDLGITVDLTMNETGVEIEIPTENIVFNGDGGSTDPGEGDNDDKPIEVTGLNRTFNLGKQDSPTVQVKIFAPNGIQKLLVTITSDNDPFVATLEGFGLYKQFDLANPGELFGVLSGSLEDGEGIGLIDPNDPIKGKTEYLFDVSTFMTLLKLYGLSNNTFAITVSDGISQDVSGDLKINVIE